MTLSLSGLPSMRILIGLFQERKEINHFSTRRGVTTMSLVEVGPFFSREQAFSWMQELHGRIDNSEIAYIPERDVVGLPWFGFTLEE